MKLAADPSSWQSRGRLASTNANVVKAAHGMKALADDLKQKNQQIKHAREDKAVGNQRMRSKRQP